MTEKMVKKRYGGIWKESINVYCVIYNKIWAIKKSKRKMSEKIRSFFVQKRAEKRE